MLEQGFVIVKLPSTAPELLLSLEITLADNHGRNPLTSKYSCEITVVPLEVKEEFDFNAEDFENKIDTEKDANLPPPFMTVGELDDKQRIKVRFSRPVSFKLANIRLL